MRWVWLGCVAVMLLGCGARDTGDKVLVVGMELAYPPFEMTDASSHPAGVSVDLARELGAALGYQVEIRNLPFASLITELQTGSIDLILSSMTATEERAKRVDFSDPYLQTGLSLLVGARSGVERLEDLNATGRRVAVKQGTTGHDFARRNLTLAEVLVFDHESAAVLEVAQGRVDAFIYDQLSVLRNWQREKERTRALLEPFQRESWAIAVRKDRPELLGAVNAFLREFRAKGGFDALGDRWLAKEKADFRERGVPFLF